MIVEIQIIREARWNENRYRIRVSDRLGLAATLPFSFKLSDAMGLVKVLRGCYQRAGYEVKISRGHSLV